MAHINRLAHLPVKPDGVTRKRLVLARQIYLRSLVDAFSKHSQVARMMGLIGLDLAVETALKATVAALDPAKRAADSFPGLVQQAEAELASRSIVLPDKGNILHVHKLRNDTQHEARYPSSTDVADCRTYVRDALERLTSEVWGVSFEHMKLADLIRDDDVRPVLEAAQQALEAAEPKECIEKAGEALAMAIRAVQAAVVGGESPLRKSIVVTNARGRPDEDREMLRAFQRMQEALLFLAMGLDYASYIQFREIAGSTQFSYTGKAGHWGLKGDPTPEEAEYVLSYAIDAVSQIEERVGTLSKPFGSERRF